MSETRQQAADAPGEDKFRVIAPALSLPKGGGAIKGIGEKFAANPVTGTGLMSVPIATSPGRSGFGPQLALSYDSGAGNGPFGLGWRLSLASITRKTDKGLPQYLDSDESDVFILSGAEDLVPLAQADGQCPPVQEVVVHETRYCVAAYRPRVEGLFARIERWTDITDPGNVFWRSISRDNITTWYGRSPDSRIANPDEPTRIFEWLICESHDDKGNVIEYEYCEDKPVDLDTVSVWEANRTEHQRIANRYPNVIRYGNGNPFMPRLEAKGEWPDPAAGPKTPWMFYVVFDYGDPASAPKSFDETQSSPPRLRADVFSNHRPGFEVRCHRLCSRVLMFHHFPDELGSDPVLVRSTDFGYAQPNAATFASPLASGYTVLQSVTQRGYQCNPDGSGYDSRGLPPTTFTYSQAAVDQTPHTIAALQLENLPVGTQGPGYQWIDLDGEGLSGVLSEQLGAWYYKPNLGDCTFGPMRLIGRLPAMPLASGSCHQFLDLAGNGEIDVVDFAGPTPGFHERDRDEGWKRHIPFASLPNIDWQDSNLRFVDLTGDGHADALITEGEVFTWYPSLDERGFAASQRSPQPVDEDVGPHVVFADGTQTIFLADMSGDGLTDLVRIRNGQVCYWPNLGYGRFGRKVTLGNSQCFDAPDLFDPRRIRLADIDGSGPVDLIYLGCDGARLYFNRSGNSLSDPLTVNLPVATDNLGAVQVADLLGNGTACLVWNSHLPADADHPVRYIDLMGGQKPHLLVKVDNNLGATTTVEYTPSTRFYLDDQAAGRPWITRLSFPVHCVSSVTVEDKWRESSFTSTYSYHHGYFDGIEREFRGFGRVEQIDTECFDDPALDQAPVKTVTWYHTGAALDRQRILNQFKGEYFPAGYTVSGDFHEKALPEPELSADLFADEWRQALRACKGMVLRQEVYELAPDNRLPTRIFSAAFHNCRIQCLQRQGTNRHAVFLVTESEALSYHYELALSAPGTGGEIAPDPRISHTLNLHHDEYGNIEQALTIGYGRWPAGDYGTLPKPALIAAVQNETHIAYAETRYTKDVFVTAEGDNRPLRHHRLRLPYEALTYELKGIARTNVRYYGLDDFRNLHLSDVYGPQPTDTPPPTAVESKAYHEFTDGKAPKKRLVEHARTGYFDDASDTTAPVAALPFGTLGPRGLKYEDYKLALTSDLLDAVFTQTDDIGQVDDKLSWEAEPAQDATPAKTVRDLLDDPKVAGYWPGPKIGAHPGEYWMRSGTAGFAADAHERFFLPERYIDPFENVTTLEYDALDLFVRRSTDAKLNTVAIAESASGQPRFDYRVLAQIEMIDASGNRSEVRFDILGRVVAMATKGEPVGAGWQGDDLDSFTHTLTNPSGDEVAAFCSANALDEAKARTWLGNASARFVYHFGEIIDDKGQTQWAQRPAGACAIAREIRARLPGGSDSPLQVSLECSDGIGNVLMKKQQAEPEPGKTALRWIVNGLTVLNNKGKPVKQYEPAFSESGFGCEPPLANGVTPLIHYDALGRVVRTDMPDGTFSRVEFSPWDVATWDQNDTAQESDWYAAHASIDPEVRLPVGLDGLVTVNAEARAAWLAIRHACTPARTILDSLGRDIIAIAHNRVEDSAGSYTFDGRQWKDEFYPTFTKLDAEGKPLWIRDARDNLVMQYINPPSPNDTTGDEMPADAVPCYDIAGNLLFQHSMDAGERWTINDATGKPLFAWDFNEWQQGANFSDQRRLYRTEYDELHRPTRQWLCIWSRPTGSKDAFTPESIEVVERMEYQDAQADDQNNLNTQLVRHYDPSGLMETIRRDYAGNVEEVRRTLVADKKASRVDWSSMANADGSQKLEAETYIQITEHDALGRMSKLYNWHRAGYPVAVYTPVYNRRGALQSESLRLHATKTADGHDPDSGKVTQAIEEIRYDAKGQKQYLALGNGTVTRYDYDPKTLRLRQIFTSRPRPDSDFPGYRAQLKDSVVFQQLLYTYDPVGNITEVEDQAYEPVYFDGGIAEPRSLYEYDALYRLTWAQGRESAESGEAAAGGGEPVYGKGFPVTDQTLRRYEESYTYDPVGNFRGFEHRVPSDSRATWTRTYASAMDNNRLMSTQASGATRVDYDYDTHGSMRNLARVSDEYLLHWDHRDMIRTIDLGGGGDVWYQYDSTKQRTRKYIERNPTNFEERVYLGGMERYRRWQGGVVVEEIESLHLFEGEQRVLLVDDVQTAVGGKQSLFRYQYGNHLGSVAAELDQDARVISYEEFHPYGTSAVRAMDSTRDVPARRYRYTGMERDEESGVNYHGARYFLPWLGRWGSTDPIGPVDGPNLYSYSKSNPMRWIDRSGHAAASDSKLLLFQKVERLFVDLMLEQGIPVENQVDLGHNAVIDVFKGSEGPHVDTKARSNGLLSVEMEREALVRNAKQAHVAGKNQTALYVLVRSRAAEKADKLGAEVKSTLSKLRELKTDLIDDLEKIGPLEKKLAKIVSDAAPELSRTQLVKSLKKSGLGVTTWKTISDRIKRSNSGNASIGAALGTAVVGVAAASAVHALGGAEEAGNFASDVASGVAGTAVEWVNSVGPTNALAAVGATFAGAKTALAAAGVAKGLAVAPHVAGAFVGGMVVGRGLDVGLHISDMTSAVGESVYAGLRESGVNETVSFVAGGIASLGAVAAALTPMGITYLAGKRFGLW